jgi:hypothetical protein
VVLADFYQAQRIIDEARSPGSMGNEGSTRPKVAGETEDEERTLNAYFVTAERLNNRSEFFAQHSNPRFPGARGWAPCPLVSHPSGRIPCNDAVSIAAAAGYPRRARCRSPTEAIVPKRAERFIWAMDP